MSIKPAIRTDAEIDAIVFSQDFSGGHRKISNARRKMRQWSNDLINAEIHAIRDKIQRMKKHDDAKEQDVRHLYAEITKLELKLI